ncbi:NB-ARC domain-containing protein [Favolaschia claudopus]|uniref:NB-ARC domain-containing protein n=1 Tax=Favolaschia claudopus TaxID=2862362 RepID=A0AAW0DMZ8_9AGAR
MPAAVTYKILDYTSTAATALREIAVSTDTPFLATACDLALRIVSLVQETRYYKERCHRILEQIHQSLCVLSTLCVEAKDGLSPRMINQMAQYAATLEKFYICLQSQNDIGPLKRLLKQNEIASQLTMCEKGLQTALEVFMTDYAAVANEVLHLENDTEARHQELLELISRRSISVDDSSIAKHSSFNTSTGSFSLLPASPKVFYGRETELESLVATLLSDGPRVAILGPGGMGKTTLAMAALHHPTIIPKYALRHFISCDSSPSCGDLITNLGLQLGLEPSRQLTKSISFYLRKYGPCLIVLDNFETPWEPSESRAEVEEFLSQLADVPNLGLLVTMRGSERPGKVKWNRPFLPPLEPLSLASSRQIFFDIADEPEPGEESVLDDLLTLSGNLPLALSLLANVASFEGYSGALDRWRIENFTLLSLGNDKSSNLETSITLSLRSTQISSFPPAQELLSLLSLLPDGVLTKDIAASKVAIPDVGRCISLLLRMSLAYTDTRGRIKALNPIREFIRRAYPPSKTLCNSFRVYFQDLLDIWGSTHKRVPSAGLTAELMGNLGNINELFFEGLVTEDPSTLKFIGLSIITLDEFSHTMLQGMHPLFRRLPHLIRVSDDAELRWRYGGRCLRYSDPIRTAGENLDVWIQEGMEYFDAQTHPNDQAIIFFHSAAAHYNLVEFLDIQKSMELNKRALSLADEAGNVELQLLCLDTEFDIAHRLGERSRQFEIVRRGLALAESSSNHSVLQSNWLMTDAWLNILVGNLPRALASCTQADEILESCGMLESEKHLWALNIRGEVHLNKSEYIEARQLTVEILRTKSLAVLERHYANALISMAQLDILIGGPEEEILASIQTAEKVYETLDAHRILLCSMMRGYLDVRSGNTDSARSRFLSSATKSRGTYTDSHSMCLIALGDPKHQFFDPTETLRWAVVSLSFERLSQNFVNSLTAVRCLADTHVLLEDDETALSLFQVALEGGTQIDIHRLRAECMTGIGDVWFRRGDLKQAEEMWTNAHPLFLRSSQIKDAAAVEERLEGLRSASA